MITTVHSLALQLLRDMGITTLDTTSNLDNTIARPVTTADKNAVLLAINGAYEEVFKDGPASIRQSIKGGVLRPPTSITADVTQYSTTLANVTTYVSWMKGCTIRIAGDEHDNELIDATTLARPFMGSTASGATITVYSDCIPLSGVSHIMGPITILGKGSIPQASSREEFDMNCGVEQAGTAYDMPRGSSYFSSQTDKYSGDPTVAFCDTRLISTETGLQKFLRFNLLPASAMAVRYNATLLPPSFVIANIGDVYGTDPGTTMPLDGLSSIIYAIARKRISADPLFDSTGAKLAEINRQYAHALTQLTDAPVAVSAKLATFH